MERKSLSRHATREISNLDVKTDSPLVSFCLTSYNQRQYIGAAVEAALAQDYENR